MAENNKGDTSNRGFASMDEDEQRDIARKGGESVPATRSPGYRAVSRAASASGVPGAPP